MIGRLRDWLRRRAATGPRGERAAARFLKRRGYRILARNLRSRVGEIDLLAQPRNDPRTLVVVEVKAGQPGDFPPEWHVNAAKQRKLATLGAQLLRSRKLAGHRIRYDVVAVEFPPQGKPTLRHHPGAFESLV